MEQRTFTDTGKNPPVAEDWQNQLNAICSLILLLFQRLIQMDHASSWRTWSRPEKNCSRQSERWDLCDQHKLEQPLGCSKLCLEVFQVLIRMKCSLGLLFSLFICDEHKLETKIQEFAHTASTVGNNFYSMFINLKSEAVSNKLQE